MRRVSEVILLALVVLSPWAFGAVEAWAELCLYAAVALITVTSFGTFRDRCCRSCFFAPASLALAGLALLGCLQAVPLGHSFSQWLSPVVTAKPALLPAQPEHVLGSDGAAVSFPSATISVDPDLSLQMASRLAAAWLLFLAVMNLGADAAFRSRFSQAVTVNAALLALFAIIQSLTWNGSIYWIRPSPSSSAWSAGGPFVSHNHLAAYLNIGLGFALASLFSQNPRQWLRRDSRMVGTVYAAALIVAGIVTCHSRSGFLGLSVASVLLMLSLRKRPKSSWIGVGVVLGAAGLYLFILAPFSSFTSRLATILDPGDSGYQSRLEVWQGAIRAWWARPIVGSGLGTFPFAVIPNLHRARPVFFARAENEYIDMLVEGGALGLFLASVFMVAIGLAVFKALRSRRGLSEPDRTFIWGALFGLTALAVQCFADFAPHVPAIGVLALILCGLLAAITQGAVDPEAPPASAAAVGIRRRFAPTLGWACCVALSAVLLTLGVRDARVEYRLHEVGLPSPGSFLPTIGTNDGPSWELEASRGALQSALQLRPNWAEGYVRLGLVHLGLYRLMAREWLEGSGTEPMEVDIMTDPLWLLGAFHTGETGDSASKLAVELRDLDPVRDHLGPATRCFLEARRCSPFWALPHGKLASLDFMLVSGDVASKYAERSLLLSGDDVALSLFLARVASEIKDHALAARSWKKALELSPTVITEVADSASLVLSPSEILSSVVPDGRTAIEFANRLFTSTEQEEARRQYFQTALTKLDGDKRISDAERLALQAEAFARLGQRKEACERMDTALMLEPEQSLWREKYINWLLEWGRPDEAHSQALVGYGLSPDSSGLRAALDRTAGALAKATP